MALGDPADSGAEVQRAIAERAREFAAGTPGYRRRPYWLSAIGLVLAGLVVFLVFFGFDSFLGGMQRVIEIIVAEEEATEPVPVFIVPDSPGQP
jgi:hypothetical protein